MDKCLLIKTKDNRHFFTHERNYPQIIEFSKLFNAEVSLVSLKEQSEILELDQLAPAFCDMNWRSARPEYKILKVKIKRENKRDMLLRNAKVIRDYIRKRLLAGEVVGLSGLAENFKKMKLTSACLCIHFKAVRNELTNLGFVIAKTGAGKYQLTPQN